MEFRRVLFRSRRGDFEARCSIMEGYPAGRGQPRSGARQPRSGSRPVHWMVPTLTSSMTEPPMTRNPFCPLALASALALSCMTMTANAQTQPPTIPASEGTLLSVSAQAEASRVPDVPSLSTGVVTQAADANAALAANAPQMNKVIAATKAAGHPAKDTRHSATNVHPPTNYQPTPTHTHPQ